MEERYAGIDLAKRTMEVCILEGDEIKRVSLKNDVEGRARLCRLLRKSDKVGMEVCAFGNMLARVLERGVGCRVYLLSPGRLRVIWDTLKKTDKEDALKIARLIQRNPEEELHAVPLVSEAEEEARMTVSAEKFLTKERTAAINRMHALYAQAGIIDVTKKDLQSAQRRQERMGELPGNLRYYARMLEEQLAVFEKQLAEAGEKMEGQVRGNELAPYVMSIPGIGIGIAAVLLAYLGDGSRFEKASEVANYAGLVPRVDCSGEKAYYGHISRRVYCAAIRSVMLEGVWAMTRSRSGGTLLDKFTALSCRMGRRKSAVAVARKMVTLAWLLMKRREFYWGADRAALEKKFKLYGIKYEKWESCA